MPVRPIVLRQDCLAFVQNAFIREAAVWRPLVARTIAKNLSSLGRVQIFTRTIW